MHRGLLTPPDPTHPERHHNRGNIAKPTQRQTGECSRFAVINQAAAIPASSSQTSPR
jgi:hypothetical protein